ncbi:acetyl-CoA carboxylase carboxyltransferase subunit alpha [Candidatus Methylacidiphilum infernorum]|uniref:Acetyl-coenzyme A carboxylase carboxyl transferase subunit alpha n=1 Tax=Candidatus Methylacidiphilum infernorum TaxID=511746 RepID=A0ABX7PWW4_9BACT|nr:acetyl-CoA carboxylase carboxyltransferase subunit alpha [Candidatus Methylacidiphilum infernorum]QSR87209.1 acetyl-CoA carboxylase carboxyltransferase subunit alpha [Candidatus Methylacidiphilum infernorum]
MTNGYLDFEKPIVDLLQRLELLKTDKSLSDQELKKRQTVLEEELLQTRKAIYSKLSPWQKVQIARHPKRPYFLDYIQRIGSDFFELNGDRLFRNDLSIVGGFVTIGDIKLMAIGHMKGRTLKENLLRNFGCPMPEGYRKAMRLMKLAEKFRLPVVTFIDTAGAYPGIGSEERHVGAAIANNLMEMSGLKVPIVSIVIGEGGSGGALGIGVADKILMMENAYYSVISPEGCAAILWKDKKHAPQAATLLKLTAQELLELKIIDQVIPEPLGGAHWDWDKAAHILKEHLLSTLIPLLALDPQQLLENRYLRYRRIGQWLEKA